MAKSLTSREATIARLIAQGLPNRRIAQVLQIREGTVKMHLHKIYTKLNLSNRTQLALWMAAEMMND